MSEQDAIGKRYMSDNAMEQCVLTATSLCSIVSGWT